MTREPRPLPRIGTPPRPSKAREVELVLIVVLSAVYLGLLVAHLVMP